MFTAYTKEIDGITVILGLDKERIDSVATAAKVRPLIEATNESKSFRERIRKIDGFSKANNSLGRQARLIMNKASIRTGKLAEEMKDTDLSSSEIGLLNGYANRKKQNDKEIAAIQKELPAVNANLKKRTNEIYLENAVFFNIKENEKRVTNPQAKDYRAKIKGLKKGQFLTIAGEVITDNRKKTFYALIDNKWDIVKIESLGEDIDLGLYCEFADMNDDNRREIAEQIEIDRVAALDIDTKEKERDISIDNLASQAAAMRGKLEIQGDSDALSKSQDFYSVGHAAVMQKYA